MTCQRCGTPADYRYCYQCTRLLREQSQELVSELRAMLLAALVGTAHELRAMAEELEQRWERMSPAPGTRVVPGDGNRLQTETRDSLHDSRERPAPIHHATVVRMMTGGE